MSASVGKKTSSEKIWTPANIITLLRICLVPVFFLALLTPWPQWFGVINIISNPVKAVLAALLFIVISCTDWIDGYLARSRGEVTDLGKFLDPLADKILVSAALIALVELQTIPAWPVLIILTREFIVSGLRMIAASKGFVIAASWYGKAKTVFQIIAVVMFLIKDFVISQSSGSELENPFYIASWLVMIVALVLTVISMLDYINKARPLLSNKAETCANESNEALVPQIENDELEALAHELIDLLQKNNLRICTAESLTGGMISSALTSVSGSSAVVRGAFVTYAISSKHDILGVDKNLLDEDGAVNDQVAKEMAEYSASKLGCDVSISATGIAGPSGAEPGKPVGTVFIGVFHDGSAYVFECHFEGDRESVRQQTVSFALKKTLDLLNS